LLKKEKEKISRKKETFFLVLVLHFLFHPLSYFSFLLLHVRSPLSKESACKGKKKKKKEKRARFSIPLSFCLL
jgi:hypothetical protein